MKLFVVLATVLAIDGPASAQEHVVHGRVVDASSRAPIVHASVMAMVGPDKADAMVDTDERGEFVLTLPSAAESVRVAKASYALTTIPIPTTDQTLDVRLARGAVLAGRVVSDAGVPRVGQAVYAYPVAADGSLATNSPFMAIGDDRGEFRIGLLPEGRYVVRGIVDVDSANRPVYADSAPTRVRAGDEIDVAITMPPATCRAPASPLVAPPPDSLPNVQRRQSTPLGGRVLTTNGIPVPCTSVRLVDSGAAAGAPDVTAVTDERGRFEFRDVPTGTFTAEARRASYESARSGPIVVPAGANRTEDLELRLIPGGVLTGVVTDDRGDPLVGVRVIADQLRRRDGRPVLVPILSLPTLTDDRGRFRIFGLPTGQYIVSSMVTGQMSVTSPPAASPLPVYYPGVSSIGATVPVNVVAGEVRDGVDIRQTRFPGVTLSGVVVGSGGLPVQTGTVNLNERARSGARQQRIAGQIVDGRFEFRSVPPGDYVVQAAFLTQFGRALVTVGDTAPSPLSIRLTEGHVVNAHLTVEGGDPASVHRVLLMPIDPDDAAPPGMISDFYRMPTGEFRASHVTGTYRFALDGPSGWFLKSLRINGRETVEQPFDFGFGNEPISDVEIVVSAAGASVTGTVRDSAAARLGYTAVVFSTDSGDWRSSSRRVRVVHSAPDGHFTATGLAPGSYYVAAIPPLDDSLWEDQISLDALIGSAERVTLNEGETTDLTLRVQTR